MTDQRFTPTDIESVVLRPGRPTDAEDLRRLAQLDSALELRGATLVAVRGQEILAAISLHSGRVIAHPFEPTTDLVALLHARAALLHGRRQRPAVLAARRMRRALAL